MNNINEQSQMIFQEEGRRLNELVLNSFKTCVRSVRNKILIPTEKECIRDYYKKNKAYSEELLQAFGKTRISREEKAITNMLKK